jgi:hypothetical protein
LFKIKNLKIRVLDSHENIKKIDWDKNTIAILIRKSNVRLSKNSNFMCIFFTYKKRIAGNNPYNNAKPNITVL